MASNLANQPLEDQFLRLHQDMKIKQEEQARHMAKLNSHVTLQQENDRLRARLEGDCIENARGNSHPRPPVKQNKGKEPIQPNGSDAVADDELSSGSSLLPDLPPPKNNVEVGSRNRPARRSNRSVSCIPHRVQREFNIERRQSEQVPENIPTW